MQSKKLAISLLVGLSLGITAAAIPLIINKVENIMGSPDMTCRVEFSTGAIIEEIPVAGSYKQMVKGLSKNDNPGPGMVFVWPDENIRNFWMKETPSYLSILYISSSGRVVQVIDMEPNSLTVHSSIIPVSQAIELPTFFVKESGIAVGATVKISRCAGI